MTNPTDPLVRLAAVETAVAQLQETGAAIVAQLQTLQKAFTDTVPRLTGVEQTLGAAAPRLAALEEAAQGFDSRVNAVEGGLAGGGQALEAHAGRLDALEAAVVEIRATLATLGQVARPGRTVMRKRVDEIQETLEEILTRLPETTPPNGGTAR